jgi:anti-anti-sigma factor
VRKSHDSGAELSVEYRADGQRPVLAVAGEIDLTTAGQFRDAVERVLDDHGRVELDLRDTTFMDGSGLAVLVAVHRRLGQNHEAIVVRDPSSAVRRVLDVSGVSQLLDVRDGDSE